MNLLERVGGKCGAGQQRGNGDGGREGARQEFQHFFVSLK